MTANSYVTEPYLHRANPDIMDDDVEPEWRVILPHTDHDYFRDPMTAQSVDLSTRMGAVGFYYHGGGVTIITFLEFDLSILYLLAVLESR